MRVFRAEPTERPSAPVDRSSQESPISRGAAATLLLVSSLTILSAAAISPALPAIEAYFSAEEDAALLTRLLVTVPALAIATLAPLLGVVADRMGRRLVLTGSVLLYGFAGMSGLVLDSLSELLVGRALLGAAVAGIMTATTAIVGDLYFGPARDRFLGLQTALTGVGGLIFMTGGGFLAEGGWRMPFAIYGIAFLLFPAVALFLPASSARAKPVTMDAAPFPWFAVAFLLFAACSNSLIFYLVPTQIPFHLRNLGMSSSTLIGVTLGALNVAMAMSSLGFGRTCARVGTAGAFACGFALMSLGYGIIAASAGSSAVALGLMFTGAGTGWIVPGLFTAALNHAPARARGRTAGALTGSIFLGQFLSPFASQAWIEWFGYAAAFRDAALLLLAAAMAAIVLWRRQGRSLASDGKS